MTPALPAVSASLTGNVLNFKKRTKKPSKESIFYRTSVLSLWLSKLMYGVSKILKRIELARDLTSTCSLLLAEQRSTDGKKLKGKAHPQRLSMYFIVFLFEIVGVGNGLDSTYNMD